MLDEPVLSRGASQLVIRCVVVFLFVLAIAQQAQAQTARLALIDPDRELEAAVRTTLTPWGTQVVVDRATPSLNTMPASAEQARAVSGRLQVQAVVWISGSEQGAALWMYDVREDRVLARPLGVAPPFDETTAASVALIVKTLLRYSDVPPAAERVRAPERARWLSVGILAGARGALGTPDSLEPRVGATLTFWPTALSQRLGAGLEIVAGSGLRVDHARFTGHWSELNLLLRAQGRFPFSSTLDGGLGLAGGLDVTSLDGRVISTGEDSEATRINATLAASGELGFRPIPTLRLGARLELGRPFRKQTYLADGVPFFTVKALRIQGLFVLELFAL